MDYAFRKAELIEIIILPWYMYFSVKIKSRIWGDEGHDDRLGKAKHRIKTRHSR